MKAPRRLHLNPPDPNPPAIPNGSGAAAILAAAIGCAALAALAIAGDKSPHIKAVLNFYKPTGPLSGVSTIAIFVWLVTWAVCDARWRHRTLPVNRINAIAFTLLGLAFLLTFPPIVDLF